MRILSYLKTNKNLSWSIALHITLFIIFGFGIGFSVQKMTISSAPIMIDLSKVEISQKTNLPPEKNLKTEKKDKTVKKKYTPPKQKKEITKPVKEKKQQTKVIEKTSKPAKKIEKQKTEPAKKEQKIKEPDLSSLLASVEKLKPDEINQSPSPVQKEMETKDDKGIKNGSVGNPELTISVGEKDAIASKLRACWNIDAGAKGVLDMQIGIRAYLDKNGDITDVKIIDNARYDKNQVFRAVADSARRAVYVCDRKGNESPFKILSKNYPDKYNIWQELYLQFNPLDGGVF